MTVAERLWLVATDVSKSIDGAHLLDPVSLTATFGTATVLRGPNGAGKTTLLRLLAGRLDPTTGTVTLGGDDVDERLPAIRDQVATLLGPPAAYPDLTVRDHLTLVDATWGRDPATCEARVRAILEELTIDSLASRFPHELSSGQTQLFHLALVLFRPPGCSSSTNPSSGSTTTGDNCSSRSCGGGGMRVPSS